MRKAFRDELFTQVMNRLSPAIDQFILEKVRESDEYKDTMDAIKYNRETYRSLTIVCHADKLDILQKFPNACIDNSGFFADFTRVNPFTLKIAASMMVENDKN